MDPTLEEITRLAQLQLGVRAIDPDTLLVEELRAESADLLNLVASIEDLFDIVIDEEKLPEIRTARNLFEIVNQTRQSNPAAEA
jgi:acyl carrier protein